MPRITITLPDYLHEFVLAEVAEKKPLLSASDFILEQLSRAYDAKHADELEELLLEGLNSGPATPMTKADWERIRKEGKKRIALIKGQHGKRRKAARSRA
jgi:antitoxin ParD1/3/4